MEWPFGLYRVDETNLALNCGLRTTLNPSYDCYALFAFSKPRAKPELRYVLFYCL